MVFGSVSDTKTPPINPPPASSASSSSSSAPMITGASFYLQPAGSTSTHNLTPASGFRWSANHQYYNFFPGFAALNPIQRWASSPNRTDNLNSSVLRFGASPTLSENVRTSPLLRFGSSSNQDENKSIPFLPLGSAPNQEENKSRPVLRTGSSPNRDVKKDGISGSNRIENNEDKNEPVEPVSEGGVEEPAESVEKKGEEFDGQGKLKLRIRLPVKDNGSSENNDAGEGSVEINDAGDDSDEKNDAGDGVKGDEVEDKADPETEVSDEEEPEEPFVKTWNLRPRKPVTKPPNPGTNGGGKRGSRSRQAKATKPQAGKPQSRPRAQRATTTAPPLEQRLTGLSVPLTKEEIEEDFLKMTGEKPPKKPSKRPRNVQKQLDVCFPGLWLGSVTPEMYLVPEAPPPLKM